MNAIAYVRVSTVDQTQGLSFEAQERAISQEVARRGWTMHSLVTEARSGKSAANRPELQRALSTLARAMRTVSSSRGSTGWPARSSTC
jgi:DNA invertase Pin-like site-specific DNA recombinase